MAAVDNLFVFILVFNYFKTPVSYQNKVRRAALPCHACGRLCVAAPSGPSMWLRTAAPLTSLHALRRVNPLARHRC